MTLKSHSKIISKLLQKNVQIPLQKHPWSIGKLRYKGIFATHLEQNLEHFFTFLPFFTLVGEDNTVVETVPILGKLQNPQSITKCCKSVHTLLV